MYNPFEEVQQELQSIADFIRFGITEAAKEPLFFGHGSDNVEDEIWSLVLESLSLPFDASPVLLQARLTAKEKRLLSERLFKRIFERVPVPYLTHKAYFCDLPFYVDARVLIPRSPLAEWIKQQFSPWLDADLVHHVLDLCTGSACIAIACCFAFPEAEVDAVDISEEALEVATINREKHGLSSENLRLIASDCWENVPHKAYDLIISNPPYVGDEEMAGLPQEYLHEPDSALRAKNNGLLLVEKILEKAADYLSEQGILVVEVGNSDAALIEAFPELPFTWLEFEQGGQGVFLLTAEQLKAWAKGKEQP